MNISLLSRPSAALAVACALALPLLGACKEPDAPKPHPLPETPEQPEPPPTPPVPEDWFGDEASKVITLEQGWTPGEAEAYYTTPQGSEFMPYAIFLALEQPDSEALFRDPRNMRRFRWLTGFTSPRNPDELPIGMVKDGEALGFTCAACHTNQINFKGTGIRVDGGPPLLDFVGFMEALVAALDATLKDEAKFDRLAARIHGGPPDDAKKAALRAQLEESYKQRKADIDMNKADTAGGYARLDAFGRIFNRTLTLIESSNTNPSNGHVSYPALWDTPQHDYVQWDGFLENAGLGALGRNVGEVVGVFGRIDVKPADAPKIGYASSVNVPNLLKLEGWVTTLTSPVWPEEVLPKLDADKVKAGAALYGEHCERCHLPIDRADPAREVIAQLYKLEVIKTDPVTATNIIRYGGTSGLLEGTKEKIDSGNKFGPQLLAFQALSNLVTGIIRNNAGGEAREQIGAMAKDSKATPRQGDLARDPKNPLASLLAYKARPLNGVWASAPYLHNGSVPTLDDLLRPPAERPREFWVGRREFDPVKVGYVSTDFEGGFKFDTTLPGNSNAGHEFGIELSDEERAALVEYLKSL
ncbi:MAG: di-heme-cytochrome C peroxidase [Nannocystaceae bacterium]